MAVDNRLSVLLLVVLTAGVFSQEACKTPFHSGACVPHKQCPSLSDYFLPTRILNDDEYNFIRACVCNRGPLKVCCPNQIVPVTSATVDTDIVEPTAIPAEDVDGTWLPDPNKVECGAHSLVQHIYGGSDTTLDEFPWFALLQYEDKRGARSFECGGTLINHRYILTAAHCLKNRKIDDGLRFVNVRLGEHNTATEIDCDEDGFCSSPPQNIEIEETVVHPGYVQRNPNQHDDIALVRLKEKVQFNDYVGPICLPSSGFRSTQVGQNVTIAGFGSTGQKRHSGIKQKVNVAVWTLADCQTRFRVANRDIIDRQLCAGGQFNTDSCQGDSGGPLMTQRSEWTIEGVVSYGHRCGMEGWPGVYTRVDRYVDWIKSNLRP